MSPERRAEVNRGLAEFDGTWLTVACSCIQDGPWLHTHKRQPSNYTTDLNALSLLEAKLPPHGWNIWPVLTSTVPPRPRLTVVLDFNLDGHSGDPLVRVPDWVGRADSEAEARAECICQYLESRDVVHPQS